MSGTRARFRRQPLRKSTGLHHDGRRSFGTPISCSLRCSARTRSAASSSQCLRGCADRGDLRRRPALVVRAAKHAAVDGGQLCQRFADEQPVRLDAHHEPIAGQRASGRLANRSTMRATTPRPSPSGMTDLACPVADDPSPSLTGPHVTRAPAGPHGSVPACSAVIVIGGPLLDQSAPTSGCYVIVQLVVM